jgi:hypothetical protein
VLIWGAADQKFLTQRLKVLQNRCLLIVSHSHIDPSRSNPICRKMNGLKFEDIYMFNLSMFMFKLKHQLLPDICDKYLVTNDTSTNIILRSKGSRLMHGFARTKIRKRHVAIAGPICWEKLPRDIQILNDLIILI